MAQGIRERQNVMEINYDALQEMLRNSCSEIEGKQGERLGSGFGSYDANGIDLQAVLLPTGPRHSDTLMRPRKGSLRMRAFYRQCQRDMKEAFSFYFKHTLFVPPHTHRTCEGVLVQNIDKGNGTANLVHVRTDPECSRRLKLPCFYEGVLISPQPDQEGNKLNRPNSAFIQHTPNEAQYTYQPVAPTSANHSKQFRILSVQPGLRGSTDLRFGRRMATFQLFFSPGNRWQSDGARSGEQVGQAIGT